MEALPPNTPEVYAVGRPDLPQDVWILIFSFCADYWPALWAVCRAWRDLRPAPIRNTCPSKAIPWEFFLAALKSVSLLRWYGETRKVDPGPVFMGAAAGGHLDLAEQVFDEVNSQTETREAVFGRGLEEAARGGHPDIVRMLRVRLGGLAATIAAWEGAGESGDIEVVQELTHFYANQHPPVYPLRRAFEKASERGHLQAMHHLRDLLLPRFVPIKKPFLGALDGAARGGKKEAMELARSWEWCEMLALSAAVEAVQAGSVAGIRRLLDWIIEDNEIDPVAIFGSPFVIACSLGHQEIARLFLDRGGSRCHLDEALVVAAEKGDVPLMRVLRDWGARDYTAALAEASSSLLAHGGPDLDPESVPALRLLGRWEKEG